MSLLIGTTLVVASVILAASTFSAVAAPRGPGNWVEDSAAPSAKPPGRRPPSRAERQPEWCETQERQNRAERAICASRELWALDNRLNRVYREALTNGDTTAANQSDWIRVTRNGCGSDESCLIEAYTRRIDAIRPLGN